MTAERLCQCCCTNLYLKEMYAQHGEAVVGADVNTCSSVMFGEWKLALREHLTCFNFSFLFKKSCIA